MVGRLVIILDMKRLVVPIDIDAPPERVWSIMSDVQRWPEWTPTVNHVERIDGGKLAVGKRAKIFQPKLRPAIWRVTELREEHGSIWVGCSLFPSPSLCAG